MKAAVLYESGPPENLRYEEVSDPVCQEDGLVIRTAAVSIEGGDTLSRARLGTPPSVPHIIGYQSAGEIIEVGARVDSFRVGERVVTFDFAGSHAERRAVPAKYAWRVPEGAGEDEASVVPVAFGTAHVALFKEAKLAPGETVLVQAGASGVGLAAIQLAKQAGATVFATASTESKLSRLEPFGVDHPINYVTNDFSQIVMGLTERRGVDVVLDVVGGATLQKSFECLAQRGRVCVTGLAGRDGLSVDLWRVLRRNASLHGVFLGAEIHTDESRAMMNDLLRRVADGELKAVIDRAYPLAEAAAAHAYIESRQAFGRVILRP